MKRNFVSFLVLLFCLLSACTSKPSTQEPPPTPSDSLSEPSQIEPSTTSIRVLSPEGNFSQLCNQISNGTVTLDLSLTPSTDAICKALTEETTDAALLSTEAAVSLFFETNGAIQSIAVVSYFVDADPFDNKLQAKECLVARKTYIEDQPETVSSFLSDYKNTLAAFPSEGSSCATGWDMVDQVQNNCEVQFASGQITAIPDDSFYYLPS